MMKYPHETTSGQEQLDGRSNSRGGKSPVRSRKRVAHITTAHPHTDNRILRKECASLAAAGLDVWLLAVAPESEVRHGVNILALPRRSGRLRRMLRGPVDAWRALKQVNPDLIHVHDPELVPLAIVWRLIQRKPAVFDAHEDLPKQVAGKPYLPLLLKPVIILFARLVERAADLFLDGIVVATPAISRNFSKSTVTLVQNFPWLRDFPTPTPTDEDGPLVLSYIGGIAKERGVLEMLEGIRRSTASPRLVLAGPASSGVEAVLMADDSGRVQYRGLLPVEAVPEIIAASQAGLVLFHPLPNHLESQPTKLFEYMAAGRPFIASNFEAWQDLLGQYDCGFFIDPLNPAALASVIDTIKASPKEASAMGLRGRAALVKHFTFEAECGRLVATTEELLLR